MLGPNTGDQNTTSAVKNKCVVIYQCSCVFLSSLEGIWMKRKRFTFPNSDTHRYVTYCHWYANQRFIGCRNKGFFSSVVGKIWISKDLFVNSEYRYIFSFATLLSRSWLSTLIGWRDSKVSWRPRVNRRKRQGVKLINFRLSMTTFEWTSLRGSSCVRWNTRRWTAAEIDKEVRARCSVLCLWCAWLSKVNKRVCRENNRTALTKNFRFSPV